MALIKCKECGADISEHAKKCSHCGVVITSANSHGQNKRSKSMWIWCVSAVIIVLGCVVFYLMQPTKTESTDIDNITTSVNNDVESPIYILSLCFFDTDFEIMDIKKVSQLVQSLEELEFTKSSETETEIDFAADDSYTDFRKIKSCTYERGEGQNYIKVKITGIDSEYDIIRDGFVEIVFTNKNLVNAFLTDAESNNFTKVSPTSYQGPKYDTVYWTGADIEIDGNTIIIRKRNHGD